MNFFKYSCLALFLFPTASFSSVEIASEDAAFHIGESVIACGTIQQTTRFRRGVYLNMDKPYPHQSLTLIVWENDINNFQNKFGELSNMIGKEVCAQGTITQYKGRNQISLGNAYSLKVD